MVRKADKSVAKSLAAPVDLACTYAGGKHVRLEWICADPRVDLFIVLWSRDGKEFWIIGERIVRQQTSSARKRPSIYRFHERLPVSGTSYYKVRALDTRGRARSEFSNIVRVDITGPAAGDV
jgi:hypothetical protein